MDTAKRFKIGDWIWHSDSLWVVTAYYSRDSIVIRPWGGLEDDEVVISTF